LERFAMSVEIIELDIRGQVCPSCLLLTLREVNRHHAALMAGRASLTVYIDSRDATTTIPEAVKSMGFAANILKHRGYYQVVIARPEQPL
jgi:TusA-related sulfurtransferase